MRQEIHRVRTRNHDFAHVAHVEKASPLTDRMMLRDDPSKLKGHLPAGKLEEGCSGGFLKDVDRWSGEWIVWIAVAGPILLLSGGWYFIDTIRKRREFDRLIDTDSKAKFVRNQDRIEFLAWLLGSGYHKRAEANKTEFNLK